MDPSLSDMEVQVQALKAGGITVIRDAFKWDQVQPTPGQWKWSVPDDIMTAAAMAGVDVDAILAYSAPWASSDPSAAHSTMWPPRNAADYAAFAVAVASRYGNGGQFWRLHPELTPRPLLAIELWNEPSGYTYWQPDPSPAGYLNLARTAALAVKAVQPGIKIVVSGDLLEARSDFSIVPWLDQLLTLDPTIGQWADALSIHPYPNPGVLSPLDNSGDQRLRFDQISLIRQVETAHGVTLPLWITEIGWRTTGANSVSEQLQATYLTEAVTMARTTYGSFVQYVFPFSWDETVDTGNSAWGLRYADGSPKPAWLALVEEHAPQRGRKCRAQSA
jgi:hypothetical protein